jgi:hypothetical protein
MIVPGWLWGRFCANIYGELFEGPRWAGLRASVRIIQCAFAKRKLIVTTHVAACPMHDVDTFTAEPEQRSRVVL